MEVLEIIGFIFFIIFLGLIGSILGFTIGWFLGKWFIQTFLDPTFMNPVDPFKYDRCRVCKQVRGGLVDGECVDCRH